MSDLDPTPSPKEPVSRRDVLRLGAAGAAVAWTVPVILTLQASPAGAASEPPSQTTTPQSSPSPQPPEQPPPPPLAPPPGGESPPPPPPGGEPSTSSPTPTTETVVKEESVTVPPPTVTSTTSRTDVRAEEVTANQTAPNNGGLAFTGAEIGGLVVLGTGAVALGTAAVWSARHRDEDDESFPA
jgi:hypothetical protein